MVPSPTSVEPPGLLDSPCPPVPSLSREAEGAAPEPGSSLQQALICFASRGSFSQCLQLLLEPGAGGLGLIHWLLPRHGLSHRWGKWESRSLLGTWDDPLKSTGLDLRLPPSGESCKIPLSEPHRRRSGCQERQGLPGEQCLALVLLAWGRGQTEPPLPKCQADQNAIPSHWQRKGKSRKGTGN